MKQETTKRSRKRGKNTLDLERVIDEVECLQRSVCNLRIDIPELVVKRIHEMKKDHQKTQK